MIAKIHPSADAQSTSIGKDTCIWQFCVIFSKARIGENCNICSHCLIENDVAIGNNVTVKSGVQLWDGILIEDNVFIGPNVTFTNDLVPRSKVYPLNFEKTLLRKGCSIGANATILAGISIREYSFLGAGSVLTKTMPPYTVWYGNPARHKGYITKEGTMIELDFTNKDTRVKYELTPQGPKKVS